MESSREDAKNTRDRIKIKKKERIIKENVIKNHAVDST